MIVKNEANNLPRCLESIAEIAQQIVVVDTGSTDDTVDIAGRHGAEIFYFPWNDSFSDARNHSLAFARGQWILVMDADDELVQEDIPKLKELMGTETAEAYFLQTINSNDPHGTHPGTHHLTLRLFRNRPEYRYIGRIHESIIPSIVEHAGQKAIKVAPEVRIIHYGYAKQEVEQKNKIWRNLSLLTKELESRTPDSFLYYNLGVEYFRLGDYAKALEYFDQAEADIRWEAAFVPSLVRKKADCLALMDKTREAIQYLERMIRLYPDYTDLVYRLGLVYMGNHDLLRAVQCFHKCLNMGESPPHYPHEEGINSYLAYQALGNAYEMMLERDRALSAFRCQLISKPTDLQPVAAIIRLLLAEKGLDATVAYLDTWFDFSTPAANLGVSDLFLLHYCPTAALKFLDRAANLGAGGHRYHALKGEALLLAGRYKEALAELEAVAPESPYYSRTLRNRCLLLWVGGCCDEARSFIEHLWPPEPARDVYLMAQAALDSFPQPLSLPVGESPFNLSLYLDLLEKCICLRKWDLVKKLSSAAESSPELGPALGKALYRQGYPQQAIEWLDRGYQFALANQDLEALLIFARILRKKGMFYRAKQVLKKTINQMPAELEAFVELADVYHEQALQAVSKVSGTDALLTSLRKETHPKLSVCMIVKNEAELLPRCLASIREVADEIVIVDTGSTDNTPEIALMNGARLFKIRWPEDFAAARNFALDQATGDWILIIDADEELNPNDKAKILKLLYTEGIEGFCFQIVNFYGQEAGPDFMTDIACRLFRNRPCYRFKRTLHEQVVDEIIAYSGPSSVKIANVQILHYGYLTPIAARKKKLERNLPIVQKALALDPENRFLYYSLGVELLNAGRYDEALLNLERCYQPGLSYSSDVVLKKIVCLKEMSRFAEALALIEESLVHYPQFTDLVFLQGEIFFQLGEYEKAASCFQQCLQMGDAPLIYCGTNGMGNFRAWDYLGQTLESLGQDLEAEQAYQQALIANPKYHQPLYRWARLLRRRQTATEVADTLKNYIDLSDPSALLLLADVFMSTLDYHESIAFIHSARQRTAKNPVLEQRCLYMEGLCLAYLRRFSESAELFRTVPPRSHYYVPCLVWQYILALTVQDQDTALLILDKLIEANNTLGRRFLAAHQAAFGRKHKSVYAPDLLAVMEEIGGRLNSIGATELAGQVLAAAQSLSKTNPAFPETKA
ncbi:MAG: glycosyltransferase [Syntrophothermus sp.]|uniref:glycosyltransferase n=1 Tax=Syntrophothermus sp. TaxID=2736299 RepID=UPI00257E14D1|nr:glycosyltransferase [Syntrophothermus sp.]NSW83486.1 glycosyltransferase [Syntrophothermus sp.]